MLFQKYLEHLFFLFYYVVDITVMPRLHSHLRYSSRLSVRCERDEVRTNIDIHTLVRESCSNEARHSRHSRFLWLGTDLLTCLRELRDETRTCQECERWDECTLHILVLVLSRWEGKPGIIYSWIYLRYPLQHIMLPSLYLFFPTLALGWVESGQWCQFFFKISYCGHAF